MRPAGAPGGSGSTVLLVVGATAVVVVGLWAARRATPEAAAAGSAPWVTATPLPPPAPPPPPPSPREPTTEPLVREPVEVLGQGGTTTLDRDVGRLCVRDALGQVVYEAAVADLVKDVVHVNRPDPGRQAPSVDLRDGRRVVLSDEAYLELPLERRYSHATGPPGQTAPRGCQPPSEPVRRR